MHVQKTSIHISRRRNFYILRRSKVVNVTIYPFFSIKSIIRWPIPVKQIQVNENTSQKTETTPRNRKQIQLNENNSQKTKTNSSKPKQIQVNESKFKLRNSSCGIVVDIFCLVIHRQTCSFSPIGLLTRDFVGIADTLTS